MLILVQPPQLGVRNVDIAREVLEQLDARNLLAIDRLDLQEQVTVSRGREELLPFPNVELAVGLELGVARHLRQRRIVRHRDDLFGADPNPETTVLLLEQRILDHLIDDLILNLPVVFARQRSRAVLLAILFGRDLYALLELGDLEFLAVHAQHDIAAGTEDAHHLTDGEPCHEGDGEDVKDPLGVGAHRAQHGDFELRSGGGGEEGISLKTTTHKLKRTGVRVI